MTIWPALGLPWATLPRLKPWIMTGYAVRLIRRPPPCTCPTTSSPNPLHPSRPSPRAVVYTSSVNVRPLAVGECQPRKRGTNGLLPASCSLSVRGADVDKLQVARPYPSRLLPPRTSPSSRPRRRPSRPALNQSPSLHPLRFLPIQYCSLPPLTTVYISATGASTPAHCRTSSVKGNIGATTLRHFPGGNKHPNTCYSDHISPDLGYRPPYSTSCSRMRFSDTAWKSFDIA